MASIHAIELATVGAIRGFSRWLVDDATQEIGGGGGHQIFLSYKALAFFVCCFYIASFSVAGIIRLFGRKTEAKAVLSGSPRGAIAAVEPLRPNASPKEPESSQRKQTSGTWNTDDTDEDLDFIMLMRSNNRMLVSLVMYIAPPIFILQNWSTWNPYWWTADWCPATTLDHHLAAALLMHVQVAYYIADTPMTVYKRDTEQIVHHSIGFGLLLPPLLCGRCAVSNLAGQLSLQGSTIFVRMVKFQRFFLPKYNSLEHTLVVANFYQTWANHIFLETPYIFGAIFSAAWYEGTVYLNPDISTFQKVTCCLALCMQLLYDCRWMWTLNGSFSKYNKKVKQQ